MGVLAGELVFYWETYIDPSFRDSWAKMCVCINECISQCLDTGVMNAPGEGKLA